MYQTNTLSNHYLLDHAAPARAGWQINLKTINRFLILSIIASFIIYMLGNNDFAVKSFVMKDLKNSVNDVSMENKELEAKVTALSSYQYLSQKTTELKFVSANDVKYVPANNKIFASR